MTDRYSLVATATEVQTHIERIAREITTAHAATPLFVALLKGAAPFASQLMFQIAALRPDYHPEITYMMVATYGSGTAAGTPQIIADIDPRIDLSGRQIVIVDDVLDKGITADFVREHVITKGAQSVELAVLVDKQTDRLKDIEADYYGLKARDEWLVGMGMDDADLAHEGHRWLSEIRQINRS